MQALGLVSKTSNACADKCEICAETKSTKETCGFVQRETGLLNLIHTDLGDLKQRMTRGGKRYYVTVIGDYSRYTKLYLNKDDACISFL